MGTSLARLGCCPDMPDLDPVEMSVWSWGVRFPPPVRDPSGPQGRNCSTAAQRQHCWSRSPNTGSEVGEHTQKVPQVDWMPLDHVASSERHKALVVAPVALGQCQVRGMCCAMGQEQNSMLRVPRYSRTSGPQAALPMLKMEGTAPAGVGQYLGKVAGFH